MSKVLRIIFAFCLASLASSAVSEEAKRVISIDDVLGLSADAKSASEVGALLEARDRDTASAVRGDPASVSIDSDLGSSAGPDTQISVSLETQFTIGASSKDVRSYLNKISQAEMLSLKGEQGRRQQSIYEHYTTLMLTQERALALKNFAAQLDPFVRKAEKAQKAGNIPPVRLRNLVIFEESVKADLGLAMSEFAGQARLLSEISKVEIPTDPAAMELTKLTDAALAKVSRESYLPLQSVILEREGLLDQAAKLDRLYTITTSVGSYTDLTSKEFGYTAQVSFPLGRASKADASAARVQAAVALTSQTALEQEAAAVLAEFRQTYPMKVAELETIEKRIGLLEKLFSDIQEGFSRGLSDLADVLDSLRELQESRLAAAQVRFEIETIKSKSLLFAGDSQ